MGSANQELILKIIAKDEYSAQMRAARQAVDNMTDAEKQAALASGEHTQAQQAQEQSTTSLYGSYVELKAGLDLVSMAGDKLGQVYEFLIGDTMRYSKEVRDLSTNISLSVEETSALIQAGDDFGIEMGQMTSTLEMMTRRGIAPSVEKLAQMADEFVNTADPVERANKMMEAFGRSWTTLTPMLKEGGQAVRDAAQAGREMNLATDDSVKKAREMEIAMDNLGDRVTVLKGKIANTLIPALVELSDVAIDVADNTEILGRFLSGNSDQVKHNADVVQYMKNMYGENSDEVKLAISVQQRYLAELESGAIVQKSVVDGLKQQGDAQVFAAAGARVGGTALRELGSSAKDTATQLAALEQRRQDLFDKGFTNNDRQVQKVREQIDELRDSTGDTGKRMYDLTMELQRLAEYGFEPNSIQIQNVNRQLGDLTVAIEVTTGKFSEISPQMEDAFLAAQAGLAPLEESIDRTALSMKELNTQTLYNVAAAGLDADAALTLAVKMGIVSEDAEGAARAIAILNQRKQDGLLSNEEYANGILAISNAIVGLQDKHITVTVETIEKERRLQERQQRAEETGKPIPEMASGGSVIVPPGYPNDSYPVRVQSGERMDVTPADSTGRPTGGKATQVIINIGSISRDYTPRQAGDDIVEQMRSRGLVA